MEVAIMLSIDVCTGYSHAKASLLIQRVTSFNTCAEIFFTWITNYPHSTQCYHWQKSELKNELILSYQFLAVWLCLTQKYFEECWEPNNIGAHLISLRQISKYIYVPQKIHPKLKILSSFTHPCVVLNSYEFLSFAQHKRWYFEDCWESNDIEAQWLPLNFWKNMNRKKNHFRENISHPLLHFS